MPLQKAGRFTADEWAETLGAALREAGDDDGPRYHEGWLVALERSTLAKGLTDLTAPEVRTEAWEHSHEHTPHGKPVVLGG